MKKLPISPDSFAIYTIFTITIFVLLFISGYLGGHVGFITIITLSAVLIYYFLIWGAGMGRAFSNAPSPKSEYIDLTSLITTIIFTSYSIYISFGTQHLINFLKYKQSLSPLFFLWLSPILIPFFILFLSHNSWKYDESPSYRQSHKKFKILKELREKLENSFELAISNKDNLESYLTLSETFSKKYKNDSFVTFPVAYLAPTLANYYTKLLIHNLKNGDNLMATKIFNSYIDNIIPNSGLDKKSTDIASNAIVLSIYIKDDSIYNKVIENILVDKFSIENIDNEILLFNLACYHAIKKDKASLVPMVKQAIKYGKPPENFMNDSDFSFYLEDEDFLAALNTSKK